MTDQLRAVASSSMVQPRTTNNQRLTTMETLTEQDLEWLTTIENKMIRLRKREAANKNSLTGDITEIIEKLHWCRQMLQGRFGLPTDRDLV